LALIAYSEQALADLERLAVFLFESNTTAAVEVAAIVDDAITVLARHPLIGRPAEHGLHELVISHGSTGYTALYRYVPDAEVVLILTIRHQREAGYPE